MKLSYDNRPHAGHRKVTGAERPEEKDPLGAVPGLLSAPKQPAYGPQQEALVRQLMETIWEVRNETIDVNAVRLRPLC